MKLEIQQHTVITVHLIALLEVLLRSMWLVAGIYLLILLQIPAHVFIHDRKQKEELLIDIFLLNRTIKILHIATLILLSFHLLLYLAHRTFNGPMGHRVSV